MAGPPPKQKPKDLSLPSQNDLLNQFADEIMMAPKTSSITSDSSTQQEIPKHKGTPSYPIFDPDLVQARTSDKPNSPTTSVTDHYKDRMATLDRQVKSGDFETRYMIKGFKPGKKPDRENFNPDTDLEYGTASEKTGPEALMRSMIFVHNTMKNGAKQTNADFLGGIQLDFSDVMEQIDEQYLITQTRAANGNPDWQPDMSYQSAEGFNKWSGLHEGNWYSKDKANSVHADDQVWFDTLEANENGRMIQPVEFDYHVDGQDIVATGSNVIDPQNTDRKYNAGFVAKSDTAKKQMGYEPLKEGENRSNFTPLAPGPMSNKDAEDAATLGYSFTLKYPASEKANVPENLRSQLTDLECIVWVKSGEAFFEIIASVYDQETGKVLRRRTSASTNGGVGQWEITALSALGNE